MTSFKVAVAVMALALAVGCHTSTHPANTPQDGAKAGLALDSVETEIKRLEQVEVEAILERDTPTLSKLWDAKYVVNNPYNKIVTGVPPENRPVLQKPRTSFTREVEHLTIRENLVISMGGETIVPDDGEPHAGKTVHRRYTHIWQRVEGEWKLIARHANVYRVDDYGAESKRGVPAHESAPLTLQVLSDGQGSPLVMLGGGTGGAAAFDPHARLLAKEFRVLRPQSLRFERSETTPLPPQYSIKMESGALARSLDQLGIAEPVALVGHSFGALVALDFALDRPARVRALVLAEPPAFWVVPPEELRADATMRAMVELTRTLVPSAEPTDEQLVRYQTLLGRVGVTPPKQGQSGWEEWASRRAALQGISAVPNHTDDPGRLKALRAPVLIVTGKDTVAFHRRINDILAASLPVAERVELPGGHSAPTTAPDEFVATLREFLAHHQ